jgi:hypothetical protein
VFTDFYFVTYSIPYNIRQEVCFIVFNVKERMAKLNGELDNACHCMKNGTMEYKAVSISLRQTAKDFGATIDCLMACTGKGFCPLFIVIHSIGSTSKLMSICIVTICCIVLSSIKKVNEAMMSNVNVWPSSCWKGTINPNNPSSFNTNAHFIPDSRAIEFMRKPFTVKWHWFIDPKVSPIHHDFTELVWISIHMSVFEVNLIASRCRRRRHGVRYSRVKLKMHKNIAYHLLLC